MTCRCPGLRMWMDGDRVITVEDMRAYELNTVWLGIPLLMLMENAGRAVADLVECKLGDLNGKRVIVYTGRGGNGGDGIVAARHLTSRGARVKVVMLYPRELVSHPDTLRNLGPMERMDSVRIIYARTPADLASENADAVIDALLGVGVRGSLREPIKSAAQAINESGGLKIAVDVPTGVDPQTGTAAEGSVRADVTLTMHAAKPGLISSRASDYVGELWVADIGIPSESWVLAGPGDVAARIPERPRDARKGEGGRVLIVGGSRYYFGAPTLSAMAAYRAGADLVYLAAPQTVAVAAASLNPHIIPRPLPGETIGPNDLDTILETISKAHAVVVGPGLGLQEQTRRAVHKLLEGLRGKPVVVDADGLKHVPGAGSLWPEAVLTPHRGEAVLLAGEEAPHEELCRRIAREYNSTVVLKGPIDYICDPRGSTRRNVTGHPAMATGGTGDVLSGVIAAFMGRRVSLGRDASPLNAAAAAAYVVGMAGEKAVAGKGEGIVAADVIDAIPGVIKASRTLV